MFRALLLGHARAEITEISNEIDRLRCVLYAGKLVSLAS